MMRNSVYLRQKEDHMETGVLKQEQIELPEYIEQKLTALAAAHGKSVKTFIEYLIIESVEALEDKDTGHPSPSHDPWFNDRSNLEMVEQGMAEEKAGRTRIVSMDDIRNILEA